MTRTRSNIRSIRTRYKSLALKIVTCLILLAIIDFSTADAQHYATGNSFEAQEEIQEPAPPAPPAPPTKPVQTPIDGGLGILLAAGGLYAVPRLRKNDKTISDIT